MKDVLKADLYRFRRQKVTWILLAIAGGMTLFTSCSFGIMLGNAAWLKESLKNLEEMYSEYHFTNPFDAIAKSYGYKADSIFEFITLLLTRELVVLASIFTVTFSVRFRRTGFIVNVYALKKPSDFYFSNAVVLILFSLMIVLTGVVSSIPAGLIFFENFPWGSFMDFILYVLLLAFLIFVVLLQICTYCRISRGPSTGIYTAILYVVFGCTALYALADTILHGVFKTDFYIEYILPLGNIELLTFGKYNTYLSAFIVILLFFGISMISELVTAKNKDVI